MSEEFTRKDILQMLRRYKAGKANDREKAFVEKYYDLFDRPEYRQPLMDADKDDLEKEMEQFIFGHIHDTNPRVIKIRPLWPRIAAAASIILAIGLGTYLYTQQQTAQQPKTKIVANDVAPGKNTATLTLSDGRNILLSDALKGELAKERGVTISKTADGQLIYHINIGDTKGGGINTLSTANGETYRVQLPDGTTVWLNASSSLKYPASFANAAERRVELTGEAYFEVAKDKAHPFKVKTTDQEVTVLGTHFNINAYADEPAVKTTLLEGAVQVTANNSSIKIAPGQQAQLSGSQLKISEANLAEAVAWKNGNFVFYGENIKSIMRTLSRWYDIEVTYEGPVTSELYYADISRFKNISEILRSLEKAKGVHFRIEGRRVTVMP